MTPEEFEKLTKDEKIELVIAEKIEELRVKSEMQKAADTKQAKANALSEFDVETNRQLEAIRVSRYKERLLLIESFSPKINTEEPAKVE